MNFLEARMQSLVRLARCLAVLSGGALAVAADAPAAGPEKVVSATLRAEMGKIMDEILEQATDEQKKQLPPGAKNIDEMKEFMLKQIDAVITVSAEAEKKFQKGEFDDVSNKKILDGFISILDKIKIDLPAPTKIFFAGHAKNTLHGARLELAVRITQMALANIQKMLEKK
jgi:hypothetical protein